MNLTTENVKTLYNYWNSYFGVKNNNVKIEMPLTIDSVFNSYLYDISKTLSFRLNSNICFCEKDSSFFNVYCANNNVINKHEFGFKAKRKFYEFISEYDIIITSNFPISKDSFGSNKEILRYELIRNFLTSNHTHFFSKDLPFSIDDKTVFFTDDFIKLIKSNENTYNAIIFGSFLLNSFEIGVTIDDVVLKPNITISPYGRWYWSGTTRVQNDIKAREKIYRKCLKYGKVLNIDLISGEPSILSDLSGSKLLKKLVKCRIQLTKNGDIELSNTIKDVLNIFIHSIDSPYVAYSKFKNNNINYLEVEKKLKISVFDIFSYLQNEFLCYNNNILTEYRNNLSVTENFRRIVNPGNIIYSEIELIKEHRKFLQGLTHDKVLNIAKIIYEKTKLMPIFTIHDSLSYFIDDDSEIAKINDIIESITNALKAPLTIEIIELEDKVKL